MKSKKQKEPDQMVLYRCPYCGELGLKSLFELQNKDIWSCEFCGHEMRVA